MLKFKMSTKTKKSKIGQETKRIGKFSVVGVVNTLIDIGLFNILTLILLLPVVMASLVSTTAAMTFSFFANRGWVFESKTRNIFKQAIIFLTVTAFGLWVLHTGVVYLLTQKWLFLSNFGISIAKSLGLSHFLSNEFIKINTAKVAGILVSMTWNYIMYKKVVFKS